MQGIMTLEEFKDFVKSGKPLDTEEIHQFMDKMGGEARKITFRLNSAYHTPEEIRDILSINACCHFQDHGGVRIGDGCQIGHNVVFATLNHFLDPEKRKMTYSAPIVLGKNVWIGSSATILQGVTIGDNAVIGAGAVVTGDIPADTVAVGVPARVVKHI